MANKNDLRFIKTERLIEETYIALKKKTSVPIKVSDLCEAALINKTTFYAHYENMNLLHQHICEKLVTGILNECPNVQEAFTNTEAFVTSTMNAFQQNGEILKTIYGDNETALINNVESVLLERYLQGNEPPEAEMMISFALGGTARLLIKSQEPSRVRTVVSLLKKLF